MKNISRFFTIYWIIYFPTCIAYNDLPGFSSVDEAMTVLLLIYTLWMYSNNRSINKRPLKEFIACIGLITFYIIYSLLFGSNVSGAVWLDLMQEIRPYAIIYCTWILNPRFTKKQKKWMLGTMVLTLFSWIVYHPQTLDTQVEAEFPVLGQLAICTGMSWYLFTKETKRNRNIALLLVLTGMLAPKFKFMGEVVCIGFVYFVKNRLNFKSPKTMLYVFVLIVAVLVVTWTKFDVYYVSGLSNDQLARPMTYKTSLQILWDYFPFGSGMGSFACNAAWKFYSPLYYKYNLNGIWGLDEGGGFICDAYYPTLAQFGIVGIFFFCWFWKRRLNAFKKIVDMRYYRIAMITFCCLAIEQTADSSWLSGKGMGYCMLIALCLNANRNMMEQRRREEMRKEMMEKRRMAANSKTEELTLAEKI